MTREDLVQYCLTFLAAYEDYPFGVSETAGTWTAIRHRGNKKTFAFVYERQGRLCVNLKCDPLEARLLRSAFADITPAYHMNKEHWNTVAIGGDVPEADLMLLIERSYDLIRPKRKAQKDDA